ncbi:MAG: YybS family protein [Deltaproteobacteria bacterium]|nr:YybS family protein [Deltaproteobacteria bacterium]
MIPVPKATWPLPAAAAGGSLAIFSAPILIPFVGALLALATPVPLMLLYRRNGTAPGRQGLMWAGAGAVALYFFTPWAGLYYFLFHLALAGVMGESAGRGLAVDRRVALAALAGVVVSLGPLFLLASGQGGDFLEAWHQEWHQEMAAFLKAYQGGAEMDPAKLAEFQAAIGQAWEAIFRILPALLGSTALLVCWGNFMLVRRISQMWPDPTGQWLAPLNRWRAPELLVWVVIASGGIVLFGWEGLFWWGANFLILTGTVYFLQGMAILSYWLERKKVVRLVRVAIYTLIAVEFFLAVLIAVAGLFDVWFNFRRLDNNQPA